MLKILQARLKQYVNHELPDVQAGFRKGRGTRDEIANICWIIERSREFQKNIYFSFIGRRVLYHFSIGWNLDSSLCFIQSTISHDVLCI